MQHGKRSNLPQSRWLQWLIVGAAALIVCVGIATVILVHSGPLTRESVASDLQAGLGGKVTFGRFHSRYLPYPECVAEDVAISETNGGKTLLITVAKLTIEPGFFALFTNGIDNVRADGLRVVVPAGLGLNSGPSSPTRSKHWVKEFVADGSIVEFQGHSPGRESLRFEIHQLTLDKSGNNSQIKFHADLLNPKPPGELRADGQFGPWRTDDPGATPASGAYVLEHAKLDGFKGIAGEISSQATFRGTLSSLEIDGTTQSPNFEVKQIGHPVPLNTHFRAKVNGTNGDVVLQPVDLTVEGTALHSEVTVNWRGPEHKRKIDIEVSGDGRVQDLLKLFTRDTPAPMTGAIRLKAAIRLPPGPRPFLRKLALEGDFTIDGVRFSKPGTEQSLETMSVRAQGKKPDKQPQPEDVSARTRGHVVLRDGKADFSNLLFEVPGASAQLHGTFNLLNQRVNLEGLLKTQATLSHSTSGIKAVLLKPIDSFFKKKHAGAQVGVSITGTYGHPSFGLDLDAHK
jgi:hypothetical protein